jgi:hypothetical protein
MLWCYGIIQGTSDTSNPKKAKYNFVIGSMGLRPISKSMLTTVILHKICFHFNIFGTDPENNLRFNYKFLKFEKL